MTLLCTLLLGAMPAAPQADADPEVHTLRTGDVVARTWTVEQPDGHLEHRYRLSLDGGRSWGRERVTSYDVMLRYAEFDPLADGEPAVPDELAARPDHRLWIVQYVTQGVEPWRETIRGLGAVDHRFLANHGNVWEMDARTAADVAKLPFVRWVGAFHPVYKLEDELVEQWRRGALEHRSYHLVVGEWGPRQKALLVGEIGELGGAVEAAIDEGWIVRARLSPAQVVELAHSSLVLGIDRKGEPENDMNNARSLMGANYVETQGGFTGTGVRAEVLDSGHDTNHADWDGAGRAGGLTPILHGSNGGGSHGTCTYGINFADGDSASGNTRGVAPNAQGIMADYSYLFNRYTHTSDLLNPPYEAVYQTNSWGDPRTSSYTSVSQQMDDIIFINDIVITQSQSNAGTTASRPQAWAKNIVAVGGLYHNNNTNDSDDTWSFGASIGPAQDGRIKPDMACWYDGVWCSDADPGGYSSGDDYSSFSGTSAATPIVAGHFALLFEMWHAGIFGNPTAGSVFDSRPHSTLARALMFNTSKQWQFSGGSHDRTRTHQGWGRPHLQDMYDDRDDIFWVNEDIVLGNLEAASWDVVVPAGQPELRATLVYVDRAGTTSSSQHRINDLSLRVTDPNGVQYWGNNGLKTAMYSASGGVSNTKDTVEQVILQNPIAGTWKVDVFADELNQDTHSETGTLDADFALAVRPVDSATGTDPLDTIDLTGPATPLAGFPASFNYSAAPANASTWMIGANNVNGQVYSGHDFDVGTPTNLIASGSASATGTGSFLVNIPAGASGVTYYLEIAALDAGTWYDSNFLQIDIQ